MPLRCVAQHSESVPYCDDLFEMNEEAVFGMLRCCLFVFLPKLKADLVVSHPVCDTYRYI